MESKTKGDKKKYIGLSEDTDECRELIGRWAERAESKMTEGDN